MLLGPEGKVETYPSEGTILRGSGMSVVRDQRSRLNPGGGIPGGVFSLSVRAELRDHDSQPTRHCFFFFLMVYSWEMKSNRHIKILESDDSRLIRQC